MQFQVPAVSGVNDTEVMRLQAVAAASIKARPATVAAYAKGKAIVPEQTPMSDEAKKVLFGQTAR